MATQTPDWERIEADYRMGLATTREIGALHGVSHTAILKRAKTNGWEQDLSARIKAKADSMVSKALVSKEVSKEVLVTSAETIEIVARQSATVQLGHMAAAAKSQKLVSDLMAEIEAQTGSLELFEKLGELLDGSEDNEGGRAKQDKLNQIYRAVISTNGRIDGVKRLIEAFEKLVKIERQAYKLDDAAPPDDPADLPSTTPNDLARRVAFLLSKGLRAQKGTS